LNASVIAFAAEDSRNPPLGHAAPPSADNADRKWFPAGVRQPFPENSQSLEIRAACFSRENEVEGPGIEADSGQLEITIEHQSGTIGTDANPANVSDRASKCALDRREVTESSEPYELSNVVETALARALVLAAEAKGWDVVMQIAEELEGRRLGMPQARPRVNLAR
jgi:hypothetical protein